MNSGPAENKAPGQGKAAVPPPAVESGDEVLKAIGELQSGLGGLRALQEQTVKLGEELAKKRAAMAAEHARLTALREEVASEQAAAEALKQELAAAQKELLARQKQLEQAGEKLAAVREELEAGRAEIAAAREELAAERKRIEAMRAEGAAKGAKSREAEAKVAAAESRAAELGEQVSRLEAQLSEAAAQKAGLEARIASLEQELAEARAATRGVEALKDQLALVQQGREEAESELARRAGEAADMMTWNARRRERLRLYRTLLQVQARKLVTAKEALAKRQAECEQMLAQRQKLHAAMEAVKAAEQRLASRRARTGAAATVFFSMGALALILGMSWQITSHVRPATYLASAVIEPDGRGLTLGEAEIRSWQNYHIELARDPRMMEVAAERFRQRGIISLGTAPELRARLSADMSVQAQPDGGVLVELRGKGAEKTARELDTFVTALASVANASREGRADGAATAITRPAAAGSEPVEDDRLMYAAGGAGGGLLASLLLGGAVWARMLRSKRQYEREQLAALAEEPMWEAPTDGPAIRKPPKAKRSA